MLPLLPDLFVVGDDPVRCPASHHIIRYIDSRPVDERRNHISRTIQLRDRAELVFVHESACQCAVDLFPDPAVQAVDDVSLTTSE